MSSINLFKESRKLRHWLLGSDRVDDGYSDATKQRLLTAMNELHRGCLSYGEYRAITEDLFEDVLKAVQRVEQLESDIWSYT